MLENCQLSKITTPYTHTHTHTNTHTYTHKLHEIEKQTHDNFFKQKNKQKENKKQCLIYFIVSSYYFMTQNAPLDLEVYKMISYTGLFPVEL